jgi:hypothetical protein
MADIIRLRKFSLGYMKCLDLLDEFEKQGMKTVTMHQLQDYIFKYIGGSYLTYQRYIPFLIRMKMIKRNEDGTYDLQTRRDIEPDS